MAEAKDSCKAVSLDMDVADLRLQNLQYEKNHLVRQIRHCRDFHFDEATVQLVDEATFAKTAPAALRTPDQPHEHQVNRMRHLTLTLTLTLTITLSHLALALTLTLTLTLTCTRSTA